VSDLGKILLLLVIGLVVYLMFKSYARNKSVRPTAAQAPENMVRCAHCGINLPRSEAILADGETFCSAEHQRLKQTR
jgi:uncharacterized protein